MASPPPGAAPADAAASSSVQARTSSTTPGDAAGPGPSSSSPPAAPPAPAAAAAAAAAAGAEADDVALHYERFAAAMAARMQALTQQEEALKQTEAALSAAARRMAALSGRTSDVIHLNVGGAHLSTSRRTLTLVPDSLLGTMFSGAWDDRLTKDEAGRIFLDYDNALFTLLLNWLRGQDLGGPDAPLGQLEVERTREEELLVLIDFLQLQRFVPVRFSELWSPALSSPFVALSGSAAWRTPAGGQGSYAMAAGQHAFFDVDVQLHIEVLHFGAVTRPQGNGRDGGGAADGDDDALPNHPMFVGIMERSQLASLDQTKKRTNASWQSSCWGWWTSRRHGGEVRGGTSKLVGRQALWAEGDSLNLSIDAAKHPGRTCPRLSLANTRTTSRMALDIVPGPEGCFEEQWVVVVGLAGRGDEVRINSARRKGMKPQAATAEAIPPPPPPAGKGAGAAAVNGGTPSRPAAGALAGPRGGGAAAGR